MGWSPTQPRGRAIFNAAVGRPATDAIGRIADSSARPERVRRTERSFLGGAFRTSHRLIGQQQTDHRPSPAISVACTYLPVMPEAIALTMARPEPAPPTPTATALLLPQALMCLAMHADLSYMRTVTERGPARIGRPRGECVTVRNDLLHPVVLTSQRQIQALTDALASRIPHTRPICTHHGRSN
jgi:hypothetical protein